MSVRTLQALLSARRVVTLGRAVSPPQQELLRNLRDSGGLAGEYLRLPARLPEPVDLVVLFQPSALRVRGLARLQAAGCRGLIWCSSEAVPGEWLAKATGLGLRVLGPRSVGLQRPGQINVSALPTAPAGRIALIAQSASLAAAAMDWAAGRDIGFSWVVTTGGDADADVGDFLDVAALDPGTQAVVLQLSYLHEARKFMSAARGCARAKPVLVLQSRLGREAGQTGADPLRSAAFQRAGLVEVGTLDELFDALAALDHLPARREMRVVVVGNGTGVCAQGVDALHRQGLDLAQCSPSSREAVLAALPQARWFAGSVDTGPLTPEQQQLILKTLLADPGVDSVMLLHSPYAGQAHRAFAEALVAQPRDPRVLSVWLGLASAAQARRLCTAHGVATFLSPLQAARALHYRRLHLRTQELLMRTPPQLALAPASRAAARALVDRAVEGGCKVLDGEVALQLLAAYGLRQSVPADPPGTQQLQLQLLRHDELGMVLAASARAGSLQTPQVYSLPPLDPLLAQRMLEPLAMGSHAGLAEALLPLSQLTLDLPEVCAASLAVVLGADGQPRLLPDARLQLDPDPWPERRRLALAPYPTELTAELLGRDGRCFQLRAVRPEDEPQLIEFLKSLEPDESRLRFFHVIRHFSHEAAARMTQVDYDRELALVLLDQQGRMAGTAQLIADADGLQAEFSVLVRHDFCGIGLGRQLMQRILDYATSHGVQRVHGDVLSDNQAMLGLARKLGFRMSLVTDDPGCVKVDWMQNNPEGRPQEISL